MLFPNQKAFSKCGEIFCNKTFLPFPKYFPTKWRKIILPQNNRSLVGTNYYYVEPSHWLHEMFSLLKPFVTMFQPGLTPKVFFFVFESTFRSARKVLFVD
jgi:hypothetical protein